MAIEVDGLSYTYPDGTSALDNASLSIRHGETVALLGGNGAGKTTLALHLNGLVPPPPGRVRVDGLDVAEPSLLAEIRRRLQIVFADADDQLFMPTVAEDVAFGPANLGRSEAEVAEIVHRVLEAVGADHLADRPPHRLSTGEKRRVALATSLAMDPDILVLDEPSAGLDPRGRRRLIDLLLTLDITAVVITHDLQLARALCPRSIVVRGGTIAADMGTERLLTDPDLLARYDLEVGSPIRD